MNATPHHCTTTVELEARPQQAPDQKSRRRRRKEVRNLVYKGIDSVLQIRTETFVCVCARERERERERERCCWSTGGIGSFFRKIHCTSTTLSDTQNVRKILLPQQSPKASTQKKGPTAESA
jgi:hypothetical protein